MKRFEPYDKMVDDLEKRSQKNLAAPLGSYEFQLVQATLGTVIPSYTTKILTFCTHSYTHECFRLHGQETSYYCTVATGQMLLDFWCFYRSQSQIATAMGTGSGGTSWGGEEKGLESLSCSHFDAQSDMSPTFDKAKVEIDANRPFDYSYPTHSMACAGYKQQNIVVVGSSPVNSLYLYDPWPPNVCLLYTSDAADE